MEKNRKNKLILNIIKSFKNKKILLIGDLILDIYVYATAIGKSLETPTIVAKEESTKISFGGASLVARNMLELGSKVSFISVIGDDKETENYIKFTHKNLEKNFVIDPKRKTTIKKRFWVDGYKMLQIDNLDNRDVDKIVFKKIAEKIEKEIKKCDAVIVSDYRHGLMTKELIEFVKKISQKNNKKVFVDSQISHRKSIHEQYKNFFTILLSEQEAKAIDKKFKAANSDSFKELQKKLGSSNLCVKLGEKGSLGLIENKLFKTQAIKINPKDTCGAGDAFMSALAISDLLKYPEESLEIANVWAGLSTLVHGTIPAKKQELLNYFSGEN